MNQLKSEKERIVYNRFLKALRGSDLTIKDKDQWKTTKLDRIFDLVIYKGRN